MKAATQALRDTLLYSNRVKALPKLRAEWEHNRYTPIQSVSASPANPPEQVEWEGIYSLDSIALPNRPKTGVAKIRLSEPITLEAEYRDTPNATRYHLASDTDPYKYWSSWERTKLTSVATNDYEFVTPITVSVAYQSNVVTNKIVVGFETSYAKPKAYYIDVYNNNVWTQVASNIVPNADGQVVLYRNAQGSWTATPVYNSATTLQGVRIRVVSMTEAYSNLDVIQLGLRLENELTDYVISYSKSFELSQRSFIAPVGKASSNQASVTLSNTDLRFNGNNAASPYFGLIDKKVKFTMELSVDASGYGGGVDERVREFTMWTDSWGGQETDSVSVSLKDSSVFLQEISMPKTFWENMTVGAIIWQLMDTVGMSNYAYRTDVLDSGQLVPYFWADEGTVWDQISNLAEGTQTAVYFDEWDIMQIRTRQAMFGNGNKTVNWNLDAIQNGDKLPDIVELSTDDDLVVNEVNINWKPAEFSDFNNGYPKMETVWEPEEDTITLRASHLTRDLLKTSDAMWIRYNEVIYWPYEAMVNIRGEILRYHGKEYTWYKPEGGVAYEIVYNLEDKQRVDAKSDPAMVWANNWTGKLMIAERGMAGTDIADHKVRPDKYTGVATNYSNTMFRPVTGGMTYFDGTLTLQPPFQAAPHDYFLIKHESQISGHPVITSGTRFRFPATNLTGDWAVAGIWIDGDWGDAGYYIEISPTATVELEGRQFRHEISLIVMPGNASHIPWIGGPENNRKGWPATILPNQWYDLDVRHSIKANADAVLTVYLDGVFVAEWLIPLGSRPAVQSPTPSDFGHTGLFTRGLTRCEFEYLYCHNHYGDPRNPNDPGTYVADPDMTGFLDIVKGGFVSGYIEREWRYGSFTSQNRGPRHEGAYWFNAVESPASYFLDEWGPIVHEVREFNVNFEGDAVPTAHSYPYLSNTAQVVCIDYWADAFGARFTLANASRRDAIVKGEDKITAGEDNPIDQKLFIYGRVLYQEEENEVIKKDQDSIRRKGVVSLSFDNRHIQTKESAEDLGEWVVTLWGQGADEVSIEIFGNCLLQLGDLVTVNHPVKGMTPANNKYYIVDIDSEFDNGYSTKLIARRARV